MNFRYSYEFFKSAKKPKGTQKDLKKGYLYIFAATVFFSAMEVALKLGGGAFNQTQLTFLRFFTGAVVLFPFAARELKKRGKSLKKGDCAFFALTGFICVVVSMTLYQTSILYSEASVVAILFSCNPVFTVFFAWLFLKEKIYPYTIISLLVSMGGLALIIGTARLGGHGLGMVLAVGAVLTFSVYSVAGRAKGAEFGGIVQTDLSFFSGSAEMFLWILLSRLPFVSDLLRGAGLGAFADVPLFRGIGPSTLPFLLFISIGVTGMGYAFYFLAMEATSSATASVIFFIKPALASLFAFVILGEGVGLQKGAGMLLILCGSFIGLVGGWKRDKETITANGVGTAR